MLILYFENVTNPKCRQIKNIKENKKKLRDDWEFNYDRYTTKTRDNQQITPMKMNIQLKWLLRDYKQQKIQFAIKELHSVDNMEKKRTQIVCGLFSTQF